MSATRPTNQSRVALNRRALAIGFTVLAAALGFSTTPALAAEAGPQWTVTSVSRPTNFAPFAAGREGEEDSYKVMVTNTGGAASDGEPVVITDEPPDGLAPAGEPVGEDMLAIARAAHEVVEPQAHFSCELRECTYSGVVEPGDTLIVTFPVEVLAGATGLEENVVRVAGGGAPDASMTTETTISNTPAGFGLSPGGSATSFSTVQAGGHPDFTTSFALNTVSPQGAQPGEMKEVTDDLPPGFAGDLVDTPACTAGTFSLRECPIDTQVGITTIAFDLGGDTHVETLPVYNLAPNAGELAKIGFDVGKGGNGNVGIQGNVTLGSNYGLKTSFYNIDQNILEIDEDSLTIWGVPASPIHDALRLGRREGNTFFGVSSEVAPAPFFTSPTSCGKTLEATLIVTSWEQQRVEEAMKFGPFAGCDLLQMEPALSAEVTSSNAYSPTGLDVATKIPQTYEDAEGLATSTLKKEVVTLPEGMTVNPSSGAGLQACSEAQYAEEGAQYVAGQGCPNESRLAAVKISTPSLKEEVTGSLFLAEPAPFKEAGKNPFSSLLAVYLVARVPHRGVLIKSPGLVEPNLVTGRLTTTFDNLPPLPFSVATFSFNQGANAPLVTPPACGDYTVTAQLTPLSDPEGAPLEPPIPPFAITSGVGGGACPVGGVPPFDPGITAGTLNNSAGSYSPLYLRIQRHDGEQEITGFATHLPPGLTGNLSGVPFCSEAEIQDARQQTGAQAQASPACPAASEIGHTVAEAGVGSVLAQAPGKLYLAGPFEGAPFSVVSVTSADVGPFDLGTVVVHLPLEINPITAQVMIPSGPADQIPHIVKGIVIHLRDIRAYVSRERFMINPTSCQPMSLSATVVGGGANPTLPADNDPVTVNDRFQAADCSSLAFKPSFKASTSAHTTRKNGASLHVDLTFPQGSLGKDANVHYVKVELPKALPARLSTLQKACTAEQFEANPADCPAASRVGYAKAITPILPRAVAGPAYFVSYGGAKFPELVMVLQGYGVTIDLHGETFISKNGITSSTFKTVPDQPVEHFELTLPQGADSALAANKNFCRGKLAMPTTIIGQNGAVVEQKTPIAVSGCKPELRVLGHQVKGTHARIRVAVPSAGTLIATSNAIARAVKRAGKASIVTIGVSLGGHYRRVLAKNPRQRVNAKVRLRFVPKHGRSLTAYVRLLMG